MPNDEVKAFFDRISGNYAAKYSAGRPFHKWYFTDRLEKATEGQILDGQRMLDIGAGTGALYDFLSRKGFDLSSYLACDISAEMLENSNVPANQRFVGSCYELQKRPKQYGQIFMLGVTTYIDREEIGDIFQWCLEQLDENGILAVTFTNRLTLNRYLYRMFSPLLKLGRASDTVASRSFPTSTFAVDEALAVLPSGFEVRKIDYLNQTFFPVNHLAPMLSIKLAKYFQKRWRGSRVLDFVSGEFLIIASKRVAA